MEKIIQVHIFKGDSHFVAECLDLPVVTQGKTLDELAQNLREAIALQLDGEKLADFGLADNLPSWRALNLSRWRMPKLKILSGPEVVRILSIFGFKVASQRGSHIKLRRKEAGSGQQTLTIPNHKELDRGRVEMSERVGQHPDHCSYAIKPAS